MVGLPSESTEALHDKQWITDAENDLYSQSSRQILQYDESNGVTSNCEQEGWEFFAWSMKRWWHIYLFILFIGFVIGILSLISTIYCCWKYKKHKFINHIITEYDQQPKEQNDKITIVYHKNGRNLQYNEINQKRRKRSQNQKIPTYKHPNNRNYRPQMHHSLSATRQRLKKPNLNKIRRKTLPPRPVNIDDAYNANNNLSRAPEEDCLLNRMRSNSDPFQPHKSKQFGPKQHVRVNKHKSIGNIHQSVRVNNCRSRSPWKEVKEQHQLKDNLVVPRPMYRKGHSSKSRRNKRKKRSRKRSKSPMANQQNSKGRTVIHHAPHMSITDDLPQLPPSEPASTPKRSMVLNLDEQKANVLDDTTGNDNVKEVEVSMIIHEGIACDDDQKQHRYIESLTNINAEGLVVGISDILADAQRSNEEESSSYTLKSGDNLMTGQSAEIEKKADVEIAISDKKGNLLVPTNSCIRYKVPHTKTKGQWM